MEHKYLAVHYQLHSVKDGERTLEEQTMREKPFVFISGFGVSLDALEQHVVELPSGSEFDFTLTPSEAFGDYYPEGVRKEKREMFEIDGKFDAQHIYPGSIITLTDNEDHYFMARVIKVEPDGVTLDTNHPLAGKTLNFTGEVIENRPATDNEVNALIKQIAGGGCSGCGGHCCSDGDCGEGCNDRQGVDGCSSGMGGCGHCH